MATARKLIPLLIGSSIRRCHLSGVLCRLTISLKIFHLRNPPSVRISISDTGIGSSSVEFHGMDLMMGPISDKWDGILSITTTGIPDREIHHFRLNLRETLASKTRLKRLPPTLKNVGTFSGTEVCLLTAEEDNFDELVSWVVHFVQKMLILKDQNITFELLVEHTDSQGSRLDHLLQQNDESIQTISRPCIECLVSGLEDYVQKHGNVIEDKCQTCLAKRENMKVGSGQSSSAANCRGTGQVVEVGIVIATMSSQSCCWRANSSSTQVLYFQDFSPSLISHTSADGLTSVDWKSYGLKLRNNFIDGDGHLVLEWENIPLFAHIDIAIHSYSKSITSQARKQTSAERSLIKKAVKNALDDLKAKCAGLFLSSHALEVREHVPALSRSIAGLIMSSNDVDFQHECAVLLGLDSTKASEEIIESCILQKITGIIEMNDGKTKGERESAPFLFECESLCEEESLDEHEHDGIEEDEYIC